MRMQVELSGAARNGSTRGPAGVGNSTTLWPQGPRGGSVAPGAGGCGLEGLPDTTCDIRSKSTAIANHSSARRGQEKQRSCVPLLPGGPSPGVSCGPNPPGAGGPRSLVHQHLETQGRKQAREWVRGHTERNAMVGCVTSPRDTLVLIPESVNGQVTFHSKRDSVHMIKFRVFR